MKTFALLVFLGAVITSGAKTATPSAPDTYREFLIAIIKGDRAGAEKLTLPNPDLPILFSEDPPPAEVQKQAIAHIEANPYRVLKIGEVFRLPNGRTVSSTEEMEKKGWVIVVNQTDPLPHMLQKVESVWKADAGDLVTARKAAAKAQR